MNNLLIKKALIFAAALLISAPAIIAGGKKILYIGDSITDGNWGMNGSPTRSLTDMNHIYGHGYMYLCAAYYMSTYPEEEYQFFNHVGKKMCWISTPTFCLFWSESTT